MYVCICNALRESQIRRAIRETGACTTDEVFKALDAEPCCGRCIPDFEVILRQEGLGPDCQSCATGCALGRKAG